MSLLPREGLTLDFLASGIRKSLLNPNLTLPAALGILLSTTSHWPSTLERIPISLPPWAKATAYSLAATSALLSLTEHLNHGFANNWTSDPSWDWSREIVLITGGSSGIGATVAQKLLRAHPATTLVIIDFAPLAWTPPPPPPAEGGRVRFFQCDLSDAAALRRVCDAVRTEVGDPTVLVNNAGLCRGFSVTEGTYADIEVTVRTNLVAPFLLVKEFLPAMVEKDHGHIVNISSMSAVIPPARMADYAATKAGLAALHESLQLELKNIHGARRVRMTLAMFSFIRTPLLRGETRQWNFFFPLLHVETVAEAIVEALLSGHGRTIYLPKIMRYVSILRGGPEWLFRIARDSTKSLGVDFKGRQEIDPETGALRAA